MVKFINLHQGGMNIHEHSLIFTKFLKYAPSFVSDPRDEKTGIVTEVFDDSEEECHSAMLHENMNISILMVHAKHVKHARARSKTSDTKRARSFDRCSSKNRLEIHHKPRFK